MQTGGRVLHSARLVLLVILATVRVPGTPAAHAPGQGAGDGVPAAVFDAQYRAAHKGRIVVDVPEVYELVNVAIAMTPTGLSSKNLVYQRSEYYTRMRAWFDPHRAHPVLASLDAELAGQPNAYFTLKMNGYAFEFDAKGRIVQSRTYDRTGFRSERFNTLRPFVPELQAFADATGFRRFYRENTATYEAQAAFYRERADIAGMRTWLERHFPTTRYDTYKVVFSPLVHGNQSTTWFEDQGFRELQPHVNFPYPQELARWLPETLSEPAAVVFRGNILFTELNHGYVNPEADRHRDRILGATSNRDRWVDPKNGPGYYPRISTFNEYMNWGLVSLRFVDAAPAAEQAAIIAGIERLMTGNRGFPQFAAFNQFLVQLYRARRPGQTIAELYPQIITWFARHN